MTFITNNERETALLGREIVQKLNPPVCIALYGELGAGKTFLTRAIVSALGYTGEITSPTYTLMHCYELEDFNIYHFDAYRINNFESLQSSGFFDCFGGNDIVIIEWADNIDKLLPKDTIKIKIGFAGETGREIEISGLDIN